MPVAMHFGPHSFSTRSAFDESANRLTLAVARARERGGPLLDLTESNPTRVGLSLSDDDLRSLLASRGSASYEPDPFGLPAARRAVAEELAHAGHSLSERHIMLTASTSEAYGYLFKLLCEPGDELLVPAPSYPLLAVLAQLEQVNLVSYPLRYDGQWHIDPQALRARCSERTRAVVTVNPNNPTGSYLKRDELELLAELGLPIVSDEVFADFALDADAIRANSALEAAPETLVFRLSGLSKSCASPQLKLAWTAIAGPEALVESARARLEHIADAFLSPNTPVQLALPALLARGPALRARIRERVRSNLQRLARALEGGAGSVLTVEGGWYAIVRVPDLLDDEAWALLLLEEDEVLVQPGYYYELAGAHLVVSLICEERMFAVACGRLAARIEAVSG